jgi:hypothetical protein
MNNGFLMVFLTQQEIGMSQETIQANVAKPNVTKKRTYSRPLFPMGLIISTTRAQDIFTEFFSRASNKMYYISVIMRVIDTEDHADLAEKELNKILADCFASLKKQVEVVKHLLKNNGEINMNSLSYSSPFETSVNIDSPRALSLLNVIKEMDELSKAIDTAWFFGLLDDKTRSESLLSARKAVAGACNKIDSLGVRAMRSAHNKKVTVVENEDTSLTVATEVTETPSNEVASVAGAIDSDQVSESTPKTSKSSKKTQATSADAELATA